MQPHSLFLLHIWKIPSPAQQRLVVHDQQGDLYAEALHQRPKRLQKEPKRLQLRDGVQPLGANVRIRRGGGGGGGSGGEGDWEGG